VAVGSNWAGQSPPRAPVNPPLAGVNPVQHGETLAIGLDRGVVHVDPVQHREAFSSEGLSVSQFRLYAQQALSVAAESISPRPAFLAQTMLSSSHSIRSSRRCRLARSPCASALPHYPTLPLRPVPPRGVVTPSQFSSQHGRLLSASSIFS
jgi:hypothetical protein